MALIKQKADLFVKKSAFIRDNDLWQLAIDAF